MKNILLVGTGNIGQRHLEGLARIREQVNIYIFDKKKNSINFKQKNFFFLKNLKSIKNFNFDLVIISTDSQPRFKIFHYISSQNNLKNIIFEKVVFQSVQQFKKAINIIKLKKIKAWVNCTRREMFFFQNLKKVLRKEKKIEMIFKSSKWEMGSNIIHYLDLFSFLIKKKNIFTIKDTKLEKKIFISKRKNYQDFFGYVTIQSGNNILRVENLKKPTKPVLSIKAKNSSIRIILSKSKKNVLLNLSNRKSVLDFNPALVSDLTEKLAINILFKNKKIRLASLNETVDEHKLIFNLFNNHLNSFSKNKIKLCPIS